LILKRYHLCSLFPTLNQAISTLKIELFSKVISYPPTE
jgi:hypothetical protein